MLGTLSSSGRSIDHITIKCALLPGRLDSISYLSAIGISDIDVLREEFRSIILRISLLDSQLTRLPEGTLSVRLACNVYIIEGYILYHLNNRYHLDTDGHHICRS